jgi:site-specific recombinase XerD
MKPNSLASLLHAFFHEWMGRQRDLSRHTVCSYRDSGSCSCDLPASADGARSRNCRLAAIHSFFAFVAHREPLAIAQCTEIARIPVKKMRRPAMCYLDADEITAVLREPDRSCLEGQRGHALLAFLYNTGARIQEALDVCPHAIRSNRPRRLSCSAKGGRVGFALCGQKLSMCSRHC